MIREDEGLRQTAVHTLKGLGLSEYAARTLVTLSVLGRATARDVAEASSVPRTRVYDAAEELEDHGLTSIEEGEPKVFDVATPARIRRRFYREYVFRLALAVWTLQGLSGHDRGGDAVGISTTTDPQEINRRFMDAVDGATQRITFLPNVSDPTPRLFAALADAIDRGVAVSIVALADLDADELREAVPGATVVDPSGPEPPECSMTRMLIVDDEIAHAGVSFAGLADHQEVGLFSDRPGTDVVELLTTLVETSIFDEFSGDEDG